MTTPSKYCADLQGGLWLQFNTIKNEWSAKPCCLYNQSYSVKQDINQEFWQHPNLLKQRQDNLNGKELPDNCLVCKKTEQNGNYSRRESFNERLGTSWSNPQSVIELDLHADFSCNLACRICGPQFSTLWRHVETQEAYNRSKHFKIRADNNNAIDLLNTMLLQDIRQIHFQGGEPLLSYTHKQILEKLEDTIDLSQIVVWYHSNATTRVNDQILKFWEKFKMIEIYFSLDDMGPRMEYQRWPVKWSEMHDNLLWYKNNIPHNTLLKVERTVSTLNLAWVLELEEWHRQYFSQTKYGDPISINYHDCGGDYDLMAITQEYKDTVLQLIPPDHWAHKRILNAAVDNSLAIARMFNHLETHDLIRKQSWRDTYPEFITWYHRYL